MIKAAGGCGGKKNLQIKLESVLLQRLGYLCHTTKTRLTVFAGCSAQRRQDIIGNRRRKSARAQRDTFGNAVKSRIVGAVMQNVKKKKKPWTICWGLNWHTRQDFAHHNNKGGLRSSSVSLTMLPTYPSIICALEILTFFLFCGPLVGFLCNTEGSKMVKSCRVFCKQHGSSSARKGSKVSTSVRHFVILKANLLLCCGCLWEK